MTRKLFAGLLTPAYRRFFF